MKIAQQFSISDIAHLTGIKPTTIRMWERRYHLPKPQRTETNIRYYDNDDLRYLMNVNLLLSKGRKISEVAKLKEAEVAAIAQEVNSVAPAAELNQIDFLVSITEMNEPLFEQLYKKSVVQVGAVRTFEERLFPVFEQLGFL